MGGRRLPITVVEGKRRLDEPVQAAKFASESGVIIRAEVPILTHWKEYKEDKDLLDNFMDKLGGRLAIDKDDAPTKNACSDLLKRGIN
uniref:Uncharacterized protein n=1 Tax=Leersia perrieri TaxID=77586 RepID=A0A0D9W3W5_9ORYZ